MTSRMPKSYTFNADSMAVSYHTKDNNVKMAEASNGGVRSNGGGREYSRVCSTSVLVSYISRILPVSDTADVAL